MSNEELVELIQNEINVSENMEQLYLQNKGMIYKIARRYSNYVDMEDLMQEGYIGLYEAVKRYESDKEVKFITYAGFWLQRAMEKCIEHQGGVVRAPRDLRQMITKYKKVVDAFEKQAGREPSDNELCSCLGISQMSLNNVKWYISCFSNLDSLEEVIADTEGLSLGDAIPSNHDVENEVIYRIVGKDLNDVWNVVYNNISEEENEVISLRYRNNMTLQAIGDKLGVTRERVRQIENKCLRKLRVPRVRRLLQDNYDLVESMAYRGSVRSFNYTWTSSTERAALKLIEKG
ncbi:sigma-70 family RNA polymerase sigma factor [Clostridium sp. Marseille-P299]|uniref:sigma-70 family RNA polymerase sigma factor n=1 Tax=Clostridium sp. Marseille-P299 TaxID=1805477 RepID=UPI0008327D39|nr:sigma-70 family RNA polymerase sigma factor [Clostridium sp. Marseille-P299]